MPDPLAPSPLQSSLTKSYTMGYWQQTSFHMLKTAGRQKVSIQQGTTTIRRLNQPVTCSTRNVDRSREPTP